MRVRTASPEETERIASEVAGKLGRGTLVLLSGQLGAGKTCFVRGLAKGLGIEEPVTSPTFTIVNQYSGSSCTLFHVDLYRLDRFPEEDISLEEMLSEGIVAVEWWEKDREFFAQITPRLEVDIEVVSEEEREIRLRWLR